MVAYYTIAGQKVGSHVLAMITLGSTFAIGAYGLRSSPSKTEQGPPIQASSKEEESFIKDFINKADDKSKAKQ